MEVPEVITQQAGRFFDGGAYDGSPDPDADAEIHLERITTDGAEAFRLDRRIGYHDRHCGAIVVPREREAFASDLTSVPDVFTWLVPKTGAHLPAALVHDGLVCDHRIEPTYIADHDISRVEADRIFRDAMADTGVGLIRRWLIWTAVTLATMVGGETGDAPDRSAVRRPTVRQRYDQVVVVVTVVVIVALGLLATADLFDRHWWFAPELPWMGDRSLTGELVGGLAGAIVVPLALGWTWGTFRRAGWIAGLAIGVLLHVTLAVALVSLVYVVAEWLAAHVPGWLLGVVAGAVAIAAIVVFVLALR